MSAVERGKELAQSEHISAASKMLVISENIDSYGGHLHHTGPLHIFEAERVRVFEQHGMPIDEMASTRGLWGFVRDIEMRYHGQVYEGEEVDIVTRVFMTRPTVLSFHQTMFSAENRKKLVEAVVDGVLVNEGGKPIKIPQDILEELGQTQVNIVQLGPEDWQVLRELKIRSIGQEPIAFEDQAKGMERYMKRPIEEWKAKLDEQASSTVYVFAKINEEYVGIVSGLISRSRYYAEIEHMYVDPNYRGRKIGRLLLEDLIQRLKGKGFIKELTLGVVETQTPAIRLYESLGFKKAKLNDVKSKRGPDTVDLSIMELKL